jgi:hypothetical protein
MATPNYFGNESESGSIIYVGPDLPIGIKNGDNLNTVISKIANQAPVSPSTTMPNTDDIITKSLIKSTGSLCASNIVNREFSYSLSTNAAGTVFTYDLVNLTKSLPSKYEVAMTRVRVIGTPVGGQAIVTDARSMGSSLSIPLNRYPVSVEMLMRVNSPCGQIDMTKTIDLNNPSLTGSFRLDLDALDLSPNSGQISLTQQLNNVEARLNSVEGKVKDAVATKSDIENHSGDIDSLTTTVSNPDSFEITYIKDTATTTEQLTKIITDLHSDIKILTEKARNQENTINSLKNQVNSL